MLYSRLKSQTSQQLRAMATFHEDEPLEGVVGMADEEWK